MMKIKLITSLLVFLLVKSIFTYANSHSSSIWSVSISSDGKTVASISGSELKLWSTATGKLIKKFDFGGSYV